MALNPRDLTRPDFIFLDAMHTLMDLDPDFPGFLAAMAEDEGIKPSAELLRSAFDEAHEKVCALLKGRTDFSIDEHRERLFWRSIDGGIFRHLGFGERSEDMAAKAFAEFESGCRFRLFDDTLKALREIGDLGIPMAIVSNGTIGMDRWMRQSLMAEHLQFIMVSVPVGWEKPGPEIFRLALERAAVAPETALFAGDSYEHDILGARAVGIPGVLISAKANGQNQDCAVLSGIAQLPGFLASLETV